MMFAINPLPGQRDTGVPCNRCHYNICVAEDVAETPTFSGKPVCRVCRLALVKDREAKAAEAHVKATQVRLLFPGSHSCLPGQQDLF